jgi:hypothetical protein
LLARLLAAKPGDITVHTLDLDLLLVDHVSPTTDGQRGDLLGDAGTDPREPVLGSRPRIRYCRNFLPRGWRGGL